MSIETYVIIGLILFFSSAMQGAVGFAFNIFAIPLLIWSGLCLSCSIVVTSVPILIQASTATYKLREYVKWREVFVAGFLRYLGIPIGFFVLVKIDSFDKNTLKQIVGVLILVILVLQAVFKVKPAKNRSFIWTVLAFLSSGILVGAVSMGGPPAILWVVARDWSAKEARAFMSALFLLASPILLILLYYNFGDKLLEYFRLGLFYTPIVLSGTLVGVKIGNRADKKSLEKILFLLLIFTSLISIFSPYI